MQCENRSAYEGISNDEWEKAYIKYRFIQPYLEGACQLKIISQEHNIPIRTAKRWVKQYREQGIVGLITLPRENYGLRVSENIQHLIEGLAFKVPRLSVANIHRAIAPVALKNNEKPPSYSTVRRIVADIDPSLLELAHNGSKAYSDKYDLVHRTEAEEPNAIWQADHTELDILVKDGSALKKPWLTIILDDYSRAVAGYALFFGAPSAIQTALAYRHAIWHKDVKGWDICGIPEVLYTDHGSDFTSHHIEQLAISLKTGLIFSAVGQPRGRGKIERFFRSVSQVLLPTLPGYQPPGTKTRDQSFLSLSQLAVRLENYIAHNYHLKAHGTTNVPPQLRWPKAGFLPRLPESLAELDLLLLTVPNMRMVHKDGIKFSGFKYIHSTLAGYVGEKVVIRYDPRDLAVIAIFHQNQFVCRAVCTELAGETVSFGEIQNARKRRLREQKQQIAERAQVSEDLLDFRTLSHEELAENAQEEPSTIIKPPSKLRRYHNE